MQRHPNARVLTSRRLYSGPIFDLLTERVELPSGLQQHVDMIEHAGAVAIAPLRADGRIVCVRQYRHATGEWLLEIPAGRVEPGEEPAYTAARELEEETGLVAARLEFVREFFPAPGFCSERIALFVARDLASKGADRRPLDEHEEIEVVERTPQELLRESRDAKTLIAAALLALETS